GDGFVISRHLSIHGVKTYVLKLYPASELQGDAKVNFEILENLNSDLIKIQNLDKVEQLDEFICEGEQLILDAVFGVGFKGTLDSHISGVFDKINNLDNNTRIAIDVPSGLEHYNQTDTCFKAELTLSIGVKKFSSMFYYGKEMSGDTISINIGVPDSEFDKYNSANMFEVEKS